MTEQRIHTRQRALLDQCMEDFDSRWDDAAGLLLSDLERKNRHGTRESVYYALGLLERGNAGDGERAERAIKQVLSLQRVCPGQPWHGTYAASLEQPYPPAAPEGYREINSETYALMLRLFDRMEGRFRESLEERAPGASGNGEIAGLLKESAQRDWPAVWDTYDPNWREFITSVFALILENYGSRLGGETCRAMEHAAELAIEGAMERIRRDLDPLNTNVWVIHILMCEMFAFRLGRKDLMDWAEAKAAALLEGYTRDGAVAEFNSPTYNGVVLTFAPLLVRYCKGPSARKLGSEMENRLWRDLSEFYNPAMGNLCGPYSRCYELDMTIHTAIPMLLYLGLEDQPFPPFSLETESAPMMFLAPPRIPEETKQKLVCSKDGRSVVRTFRELCEREAPENRHALCTATAWISDRLMIGALAGSANTSHQLHPLTVFWRGTGETLYAMDLGRTDPDGNRNHIHTVLFDFRCERNRVSGTVRNRSGRTVRLLFAFACLPDRRNPDKAEGKARVRTENGLWRLDGLDIKAVLSLEPGSKIDPGTLQRTETPEGETLGILLKDGTELSLGMEFFPE